MEITSTPAAPATAAATSSASSTASAATSTPVAVSTPAVATPVADGTGGAGALDSSGSIEAMLAAAKEKGFGDNLQPTTTETPAVEKPAEPAAAEPAAAAEAATATTPADEDSSYSLEEDGFVGAKDMAAKLDAANANLPAELRNEILASARVAERLAPYEQLFASPDEAKIISETAQEHAGFVEAFNLLATDPAKGADGVIRKLIEAGAKRDADGNILRDEKGQPLTNGIAGRFFDQIFNRALTNKILKKVEALGDENVTAALDLVMESVGLRTSTAVQDQGQDPALTARKAELDAQQAQINAQREAATKEQKTQYDNALTGDLQSLYEGETGKLLNAATGLDAFTRSAVEQKVDSAIRKAIKGNTAYQLRKDRLLAMPLSPERRSKEVALAREFFRDNLVRIAKPILLEAGISVKGKVSERTAAQAAREESARSEVNGGRAASPNAANATNPAQQQAQAIEAFKATNGGRAPSDSELNIALMLAAVERRNRAA